MAVESALCAVIAGWEIVTRIVIGPKQAQPMARHHGEVGHVASLVVLPHAVLEGLGRALSHVIRRLADPHDALEVLVCSWWVDELDPVEVEHALMPAESKHLGLLRRGESARGLWSHGTVLPEATSTTSKNLKIRFSSRG